MKQAKLQRHVLNKMRCYLGKAVDDDDQEEDQDEDLVQAIAAVIGPAAQAAAPLAAAPQAAAPALQARAEGFAGEGWGVGGR